jgi:flagellar protein FlaF
MEQTKLYDEIYRESLDGRELEASVLLRGAQKLNQCARNWENRKTAEFREKLANAIEFNQKLWSFLQVELSNPANPMAESLRLNLLELSRFIDQRIFVLLSDRGTVEDLVAIASINRRIAEGLHAKKADPPPSEVEEDDGRSQAHPFDVTG